MTPQGHEKFDHLILQTKLLKILKAFFFKITIHLIKEL